MMRHFFGGIKVCDMIDQLRPKLILELGAGNGHFSIVTLAYRLKEGLSYDLVSISDAKECPLVYIADPIAKNFCYVSGITFDVLSTWTFIIGQTPFNKTIDMALVDSDHNYFTVKKELNGLYPILSGSCVILFHDVLTPSTKRNEFVQTKRYANGDSYPEEEINETLNVHFMEAVNEFMKEHPEFKVLKKSDESEGCLAIGRNFELKENPPCVN